MLKRFGLPLLLLGVTFVWWPSFELQYETPKMLFFRIAVSMWGVAWIIAIIKERKISIPVLPRSAWIALAAVMIANLWSFAGSIDWFRSFWGSPYRFQGIYSFLHYAALFGIVLTTWNSVMQKRLTVTVGIVCVGLSILNFWDFFVVKDPYFHGRPIASLGNPVYVAQLLVLVFPLLVATALTQQKKILWGTIAAFTGISIFLTASRGSILGLVISMLFFAIVYARIRGIQALTSWALGVAGILCAALIVLNIFATQPWIQNNTILRRLTFNAYDSIKPIESRFDIWDGTLHMIKDHPLFGIGQDTFDIEFVPYASADLKKDPALFADRAHNLTLDITASYGIVGLLAYTGFFIVILIHGLRFIVRKRLTEKSLTALALLTGFIGIVIAAQFNFFVHIHHIFFWTLVAAFLATIAPRTETKKLCFSSSQEWFLIIAVTVIAGLNIAFFNVLPALAL